MLDRSRLLGFGLARSPTARRKLCGRIILCFNVNTIYNNNNNIKWRMWPAAASGGVTGQRTDDHWWWWWAPPPGAGVYVCSSHAPPEPLLRARTHVVLPLPMPQHGSAGVRAVGAPVGDTFRDGRFTVKFKIGRGPSRKGRRRVWGGLRNTFVARHRVHYYYYRPEPLRHASRRVVPFFTTLYIYANPSRTARPSAFVLYAPEFFFFHFFSNSHFAL